MKENAKKGGQKIREMRQGKTFEEIYGEKASLIKRKIARTVSLRHKEGIYKNCYSQEAGEKRKRTIIQRHLEGKINPYDNKNRKTGYYYARKHRKWVHLNLKLFRF